MTDSTGKSAMVVNGDPEQLGFLARAITDEGIGVACFAAASEALASIQEDGPPDVIITDLHAHDIDGWRFCRLLRSPEFKCANKTPVLVTSWIYSGADVTDITRELGANDFLTLPCSREVLATAVGRLLANDGHVDGPFALIIEDDPLLARGLQQGIKKYGYEAARVSNAIEAVKMFREKNPDVVLMDHNIEDAEGLDIIEEFKKPGASAVVVVITGDLSTGLSVEYMKRGADEFIHKPFDVKYLVGLITRAQRQRALLRVEELLAERSRASRERDAQILRASKLVSLGELSAGIAHEINNPVNGMMNCADILLTDFEMEDEARRFAGMIKSECERVSVIVRRMLTFAKREGADESPETVDLKEIIDDSLALTDPHARKSGILVDVRIDEEARTVNCMKVQMQEVVVNLVINACDALNERYHEPDPNKTLRIEVKQGALRGSRAVLLIVEDQGVGIPGDRKERLFKPFFSMKEEGTGLGLSIVNGIVKRHGGVITVESEPGNGARFEVCLPVRWTFRKEEM